MSDILEIDSVTKHFGSRAVLTDIYLKCETGDILGLLGRNGVGKSTLLEILFGTLAADNKFIRINGKVYNHPYKTNNVLCYLPQHQFLPQHLIVDKVVTLYIGKAKTTSFFDDQILTKLKGSRVSNLSGGELRYLEIKLLLNTASKFIILDEPFNGVSPILIESIKEMILEASKTKGIILTDHDYQNVFNLSNKCCLILDGGIKTIKNKYDLVEWGYIPASRVDF